MIHLRRGHSLRPMLPSCWIFGHRDCLQLLTIILTSLAASAADPTIKRPSVNSTMISLAFAHRHAQPKWLTPENDRALKVKLIHSLKGRTELDAATVAELFDPAQVKSHLSPVKSISLAAMEAAMNESVPPLRMKLNSAVRAHADLLATQFDMIDPEKHAAVNDFAPWIAKSYKPGEPLGAIVICTGNTRRSILGATMGNIAAAYYGFESFRFGSGGTDPDAFNPRTMTALKAIGVTIEPTGDDAPSGSSLNPNPVYTMTWGQGLDRKEFSKRYTDAVNPQKGFAALLVCSEADASCPQVNNAAVRIAIPYIDPKAYDGATIEAAKYAERRDDIGRFMMAAMMQARRLIDAAAAK
jgi:arsenate reductase (thioredoxin)